MCIRDRPDHEQLWAYTRSWQGQTLLMVANLSSGTVEVDWTELPSVAGAQLLLGTHEGDAGVLLRPWESRIYLIG